MTQQAILSGFEIEGGATLTVTFVDATSTTFTGSNSFYTNIISLIQEIETAITGSFNLSGNPSYKNKIEIATSKTISTVTGPSSLLTLLGLDSYTLSADLKHAYADYTPEKIFIPTHHSSDTGWFVDDDAESFKGIRGSNGNISGITFDTIKKRTVTFPWEKAVNSIADIGTTHESERSFCKILNDARTLILENSDNYYCKGLYFTNDLDTLSSTTISGDGSVSGDYIFVNAIDYTAPQVSDISNQNYFDLSVSLTTGEAPF